MTHDKDHIAIVGLGKVGTALGYLLNAAGYPVCGVCDLSDTAVQRAAVLTGASVYSLSSLAEAKADCIIIATVDDAVESVCLQISREGIVKPGMKVCHVSGAGGLDLLNAAGHCGAAVASIHPVQSFADIDSAIKSIPGSVFGITAEDGLIKEWSVKVVEDLGGIPVFVPEADKPLYHAAACMASNYLATLLFIVTQLYERLGLKPEDAAKAYIPLVRGTLANIESRGPVEALTGPIARGDIGTIEKHLQVFLNKMPQYLKAYGEIGQITVDVALHKGSIDALKADAMKKLLKGE
jgi:predicted short-subunit dehydrogenase-like oxidoreductase (DUF2520 family)